MKFIRIAALAAVFAVAVVLLLPGTAFAAVCTNGGNYVTHKDPGNVPAIGQTFQADITLNSVNLNGTGGDVRANIQVWGASHLIAGVIRTQAGGTQRYAELDGAFLFKVNASQNTTYTASIKRDAADSYTVKVGTNSRSGISIGNPPLATTTFGVNNQGTGSGGGTCQTVDFTLAGFGPWNDYTNWGSTQAPPYYMTIGSGGGTSFLKFTGP